MKKCIEFSFTKEVSNYGNSKVQQIAHNMNIQFGNNEFEEICYIVLDHWEVLYNRLSRYGIQVTFEELRDQIFNDQPGPLNPKTLSETIEIIKYVLETITKKGINKSLDRPFMKNQE